MPLHVIELMSKYYARILVDIDLSKRTFDKILLEREGYAFKVEIDELCQNEVL